MAHIGSTRLQLNRFDFIVLGVLLALGIATGLVLLRGDHVGVQVSDLVPAPDSKENSTRSEIRLTFDEPMDTTSVEQRFQLHPAVQGEFNWRGKTMIWRPKEALAPETRHTVTITNGARNIRGRQLIEDLVWQFHTGRPRILFMSVGDVSQLNQVDTTELSIRPLTRFDDGSSVWDYAISADGAQIAFGLVRPDSSAVDLWLMNADGNDARRLLACDDSQCTGVSWSPDGRQLAYERRELNVDLGAVGGGLGPSRVWLFDVNSGNTAPLFGDNQMLGYAPRWSPDGNRLAYFDPQGGVCIVDLGTGASQLFPNQLGEIGTWSPDSQALVLVDLVFAGENYFSYVMRADLTDGTTHRLTDEQVQISEGSPFWAPSGEWIAFGRKALADGTPTPGQQLWLMRPDGTEAHPLVTDSTAHLGSISWSPDSNALAYLRFPLMQADARPEIWLVSVETGNPIKLADSGTLPSWMP